MELQPYKQGLEMSTQDPDVTGIVETLEKKRDTAIQDRAEVESRWLRDLQQFEGNTLDRVTKGDSNYRSAVSKAPPVVHLTRTRTLSIAARIINMLVPSNERSWNAEPTPVPELVKMADDQSPIMDPNTGQMAMVPDEGQPAQGMPPEQGMPPQQGMQQQQPGNYSNAGSPNIQPGKNAPAPQPGQGPIQGQGKQ